MVPKCNLKIIETDTKSILSSKIHIPPISPQKYIYHRSLLENTYTTDLSSKIHIPPISPLTITSGWLN